MSDQTKPNSDETEDKNNANSTGFAEGDATTSAKAGETSSGGTSASLTQEAKTVAADIADQAKRSTSDAAERLRSAVEEQKTASAERVKEIAGAIDRAANELDGEIPQAAQYVRLAARELGNASDAVLHREVGDLFGVVQDFARRQPAAFLGATALAGFAAVRFLMTSAQPGRTQSGGNESQRKVGAASSTVGASASSSGQPDEVKDSVAALERRLSEPSTASGDPGGVSPQAPGFETKTPTSDERET